MSNINVNDLKFDYENGHKVLDGINILIQNGESVAIVGQNGAGKTTFAKILNGLLKPTSGDVIIDGLNTKEYTTAQLSKKIGYVFQNPDDQIFHDNVYDEVAFAPKKAGLSEEEINDIVQEVAKVCELQDSLDNNPYDLPYSTRKFVAMASVLALNPNSIILDEPTAGQDKRGIDIIKNIINYLLEKDKSIITITHDMEFTVENFNRIIVLSNKKKLADGRPNEVFWNLDILKAAQLKQPYVSRVANKSNVGENIVSIDEFVDEMKKTAKR